MAGGVVCCDALCSDGVWRLALFCFPLYHTALQCVCCHSIVGLVSCLCGRVVSLWNGGGGWVVFIRYPCCGVCFSVMVFIVCLSLCCGVVCVVVYVWWCVSCFVLSYCVVGCGVAVV